MTRSTRKVRPDRCTCARWRSSSAIACSTWATVAARTPARPCSTRSTVARLRPAWAAMSVTRCSRRSLTIRSTRFREAFLRHYRRSTCLAAVLAWSHDHADALPRRRRSTCAAPTATSTTSPPWSSRPPSEAPSRSPPTSSTTCSCTTPTGSATAPGGGGGGRARAGADRRTRGDRDPGRLPRHRGRRPGDRRVRRDDRRREDGRRAGRRPLREGRGERPGLERPGEARGARPGDVRRLLRQRRDRARVARVARAGVPGHLAGQRRATRRAGAGPAPRLPPRLHGERPDRAVPDPRAPALAGADAAGRGRALGHAGRERTDDVPAALPQVRPRLPRLAAAGVPRVLRSSTTCSCRWPRATPRSSTPRCSTAPAPTSPPTSSAWPTCCRSRRRSAARWRRSTATASSRAVYPALLDRRPRAAGVPAPRDRGVCRGLPVPDQPRPRPAGRRPHPAVAWPRSSPDADRGRAPADELASRLDGYAARRDTSR